ncbi:hypothetical protein QUF49_17260 [Fictibacillus sp. b24]|nr:hypothetical protein [Fictibacillus sp. b24]MDM5317762.1 hypothetical protein [Fictibacillus sp. b24]
MRHLYVKRPNVAQRLPCGKRAPAAEINLNNKNKEEGSYSIIEPSFL